MSRIDELIAELCPDGVEFRPLGELLAYEQPGRYLVESKNYDDSHPTPVLTAGQTFILGYTDETAGIYPASEAEPVVIFDDFTTAFKWVDFPFKAKSSAMKMLRPKSPDEVLLRFAYHAMQTIGYRPQDHARQWIGVYSGFTIPCPPLEVQREIVRILDAFTTLEAELEAELEARRRQYAYYRDSLLTFPKVEIRWVQLGAVADVRVGQAPPAEVLADSGPFDFVNAGTNASGFASVANTPGGAVTIPSRGQGGVGVVGYQSNDFWCGPLCYRITSSSGEVRTRFLYHFLKSIQPSIRGLQQAGGTPALNKKELVQVPIPIPPLAEQARIVAILDTFDALVNDLSVGLPAELAARRKQYEYYRDRLLTFKEAPA